MDLDFLNDLDTLIVGHKSFCKDQDKLKGKFSNEYIKGMKYMHLLGKILKLHDKHLQAFKTLEKQMEEENNVQ